MRNSCYERKAKAYSFISEGFAFGIRRPSPAKAEDLLRESPSYPLLSDLRQSNDRTALKIPFSVFTIMQSQALNALSWGKSEAVVPKNMNSDKAIGFKVEQTRFFSFSGVTDFWWFELSCEEKRLRFEEVANLLAKKMLVCGHSGYTYGCFA